MNIYVFIYVYKCDDFIDWQCSITICNVLVFRPLSWRRNDEAGSGAPLKGAPDPAATGIYIHICIYVYMYICIYVYIYIYTRFAYEAIRLHPDLREANCLEFVERILQGRL